MAASSIPSHTCSVYIPPEPGKPDLKSPLPKARADFKGQKGNTCAFYALQLLLDEKKRGNSAHKEISLLRKEITLIEQKRNLLLECNRTFQSLLKKTEGCNRFDIVINLKFIIDPNVKALLTKFCQQQEINDLEIYAHTTFQTESIKAHEAFLAKFPVKQEENDIDINETFEHLNQKLTNKEKITVLSKLSFKASYQAYGCTRSTWHPRQPIEKLITELAIHGPLLVAGGFGKSYYAVPEQKLIEATPKTLGRHVYGWKAGERQGTKLDALFQGRHLIVIVGAQNIDGKQHVYYLDPARGSKAGDPTSQQVFVTSYETLITHICSLSTGGRVLGKSDGATLYVAENPRGPNDYALQS